jgi:ADP-L-glycero-D-manno-heptose 6-epimerase
VNILITGGTGFVGRYVARHYVTQGHQVFVTGHERWPDGTTYLGRTFHDIAWNDLPPIDLLNHQAAITSPQYDDRHVVFDVNLFDALDLFDKAVRHGVPRIVYASSAAVYGNVPVPFREFGPARPLAPYGMAKLLLDRIAPDFVPPHVPLVGLRYSNVYGPGEEHKGTLASMVYQLGRQMTKGQRPRLYRHGEQLRDFIHVGDVTRANVLAGRFEGREVFNIGSGTATSFNTLVDLWNAELKTDLQPEYIDNPYAKTYQEFTLLDNSKARSLLGWEPLVTLPAGVAEYRKHLTDA